MNLKLINKQPLTSITLDAEVFEVMPMIGHAAFAVYCLLIFLSNTDDEFPPMEYISEATGMSEELAEASVSVLIEEGLVDVKNTRRN
jgi:hypothetical protein